MRAVVDASVATSWVLPYTLSAQAKRIRDDYVQQIHELIAPACFFDEVASALTKAERQKIIAVGKAIELLSDILQTSPTLIPHRHLLPRATIISSQTRSGLFDCLYIAVAEQEGCDVLTADQKLVRNVQMHYPFVRSIATF
jgi:predicted nucleic acid-binding protein